MGGRRVAEAEYPFANHTNAEDMGIKLKHFNIAAVFYEDDHVGDARALFNACESPGPGLLVHPTYGAVTVICRSCKIKDDLGQNQGESGADLEFLEFNAIGVFGAIASLFGVSSNNVNTASREDFQRRYRPAATVPPWRQDIVDRAQHFVNLAGTDYVRLLKPTSPAGQWRAALEMQQIVQDDVLAYSADEIDGALTEATVGVATLTEDLEYKAKSFKKLANAATGSTPGLPNGPARESEEALLSRTRVLAAVGMAETAMSATYDYVEQALRALDGVTAVLEDEAKVAYAECNNVLYLALRQYTVNVSKMMYDRAYRLPGSVAVDFVGSVYPLVAAYTIYNDAKRHRELEKRNVLVTADGRFNTVVVGVTPQ
jgi:hypothetical protein